MLTYWREDVQNELNKELCLTLAFWPSLWAGQLIDASILSAVLDATFEDKMSTFVLSLVLPITAAISYGLSGLGGQNSMLCREEVIDVITIHHNITVPEDRPKSTQIPLVLPTWIAIIVLLFVNAGKRWKSGLASLSLKTMYVWPSVSILIYVLVFVIHTSEDLTKEARDMMITTIIGCIFTIPIFSLKKLSHQISPQEPASEPSPV